MKNAFSANVFGNSSENNTQAENEDEFMAGSQIVRSAEGRRRLDKLKQSAEIKDAEIVE
ncbi:MAG: hypothetical protein MJZ19_02780 [Paludibacteraceae bacterium]|nr:hypothetical protein [Paludibacteraceae bacterium]